MEITRYKALEGKGNVVAFFSVKIPKFMGMTINSCKLVRSSNGGTFVSLPQQQYDDNGQTKYAPYIWFDKEIMERFQKGVKGALDEYLASNPQPSQQNRQPEQFKMAFQNPSVAEESDGVPF